MQAALPAAASGAAAAAARPAASPAARAADSAGGTGGGSTGGAVGGSTGGATAGTGGGTPTQATYYVSPSGSDANPGSMSAPFLTVTKARDVVRTVNSNMTADIVVSLRGGNYPVASTIAFGPQDSGTNGRRIIYQAYPGETPVLNGATKVTGWTVSSGSVYKAALARSTKLRNLYVNDARALLTRKTVTSQGGTGTYSVTSGQASWAWASGSNSDGAKYRTTDVPAIAANKDDLEIVNGTTWNENIVCVRDVVTTSDNFRGLLFQQPYGAIAQLPGWNAGFSVSGTHTIYNAFELLNGAGQFYFDKTAGTLYYYPRAGENMATADVEAPVVETLDRDRRRVEHEPGEEPDVPGDHVREHRLQPVCRGRLARQGERTGRHRVHRLRRRQLAQQQIRDHRHPARHDHGQQRRSISFVGNTIKHSGSEGISMINDVVNSTIVGNYITDIAGSGITVGHPQHVYLGDTGAHAKYAPGVEGICTNDSITNNVFYDVSSQPGFGGHAGITAFFVSGLSITNNYINKTAYNGINLGWGWQNFKDSTTCKNNAVNNNRLVNTLNRLHDSGAVYTLGQMPGTTINGNYVKGIPAATSGPTYGLHNDEGSAYITENDNVLDIDPGVKYTINCEDFGGEARSHDPQNVRDREQDGREPADQHDRSARRRRGQRLAGDAVHHLPQLGDPGRIPGDPADRARRRPRTTCSRPAVRWRAGTSSIGIRSSGNASNAVWLAPAGTTSLRRGRDDDQGVGNRDVHRRPGQRGHLQAPRRRRTGQQDGRIRRAAEGQLSVIPCTPRRARPPRRLSIFLKNPAVRTVLLRWFRSA